MINKYVFNMGRKYMCRRNKSTYLEFKLRSATLPNPTYSQTSRWAPILPCAVETRELLGLRLQELEKAGGAA